MTAAVPSPTVVFVSVLLRQHGYSKRRTWRKLHLGVDESTGEILAAVVSTNNVSDEAFGDLLDGIEGEIEAVSADGAYDKRKCYDAIAEREAEAHIPPREDAQYWDKEGETHSHCDDRVRETTRTNDVESSPKSLHRGDGLKTLPQF
jgi:hypothetical protein